MRQDLGAFLHRPHHSCLFLLGGIQKRGPELSARSGTAWIAGLIEQAGPLRFIRCQQKSGAARSRLLRFQVSDC